MSITPKAVIAQVSIGNLSLEGLMREDDGTFGIAMPQLASHDLVPQNRSLKELNTRLGTSFQSPKWRTTLNPKAVNVILLPDFERLLFELALNGNQPAQLMARDLVGLALHQLFSDAFGQKFEKEERQQWLTDRQCHREDYRPKWTDWLKRDGCIDNQYGVELINLKRALNLPAASVDTYNSMELRKLDVAYIEYNALRYTGMSHLAAISRIGK